MTFCKS
nr:unnamed protein product [Callosobruchus analis]